MLDVRLMHPFKTSVRNQARNPGETGTNVRRHFGQLCKYLFVEKVNGPTHKLHNISKML